MLTESEVLKEALELPANQRVAIARRLLESLEPTDAEQEDINAAWALEI